MTDIEIAEEANIDPAIDTSSGEPLGQLNGIMTEKVAELWQVLSTLAGSVINRDGAGGALLDNIGSVTGSLREPPKPSFVYCNCALTAASSPYLAGTLMANVNGQASNQWQNAQDVEVTEDGTYPVLFVSVQDGPIAAASGTLNQITVSVSGWSAVTNPLDATPGTLLEGDPSYRTRQVQELAAAGSCTVQSIKADLLEIPGGGVQSAEVLENTKITTDLTTGMPPKSLQAIVFDGVTPSVSNDTIAQVLWNDKPAGILYCGTTTGQAIDSQGNPQVVAFSRPTQRPLYLSFSVTLVPGAVLSTAAAAIKATIVALNAKPTTENNGYQILPGTKVKATVLRAIAENVSGVDECTGLALDFVPGPVNTLSLPIGPLEIAVLDTSRTFVNGV